MQVNKTAKQGLYSISDNSYHRFSRDSIENIYLGFNGS